VPLPVLHARPGKGAARGSVLQAASERAARGGGNAQGELEYLIRRSSTHFKYAVDCSKTTGSNIRYGPYSQGPNVPLLPQPYDTISV
jgi:hypothetical protein